MLNEGLEKEKAKATVTDEEQGTDSLTSQVSKSKLVHSQEPFKMIMFYG